MTRPLRRLNVLIGAWFLLAPWLLGYELAPLVNSLISGLAMMALASVRGRRRKDLAGGWSAVFGRPGR